MKSKFKSKCPACGEWIYEGDEIVKAGSGRWVHEYCPVVDDNNYQDDPLIRSKTEQVKRSLLDAKLDEDRPKKCLKCGNKSFLKKRTQTIKLDDGETMIMKIFICDKCFYLMHFVEK